VLHDAHIRNKQWMFLTVGKQRLWAGWLGKLGFAALAAAFMFGSEGKDA
jgi:hypothetical protein